MSKTSNAATSTCCFARQPLLFDVVCFLHSFGGGLSFFIFIYIIGPTVGVVNGQPVPHLFWGLSTPLITRYSWCPGVRLFGAFLSRHRATPMPRPGREGHFLGPVTGDGWERVSAEASLKTLSFGSLFNRSLERWSWPSGLQQLSFGERFNLSLERVAWPHSLETWLDGKGVVGNVGRGLKNRGRVLYPPKQSI